MKTPWAFVAQFAPEATTGEHRRVNLRTRHAAQPSPQSDRKTSTQPSMHIKPLKKNGACTEKHNPELLSGFVFTSPYLGCSAGQYIATLLVPTAAERSKNNTQNDSEIAVVSWMARFGFMQ